MHKSITNVKKMLNSTIPHSRVLEVSMGGRANTAYKPQQVVTFTQQYSKWYKKQTTTHAMGHFTF